MRNTGRSKIPDVNVLVEMMESLVMKINHADSMLPSAGAQMPVLSGVRVVYSIACLYLYSYDSDSCLLLRLLKLTKWLKVNMQINKIRKEKGA